MKKVIKEGIYIRNIYINILWMIALSVVVSMIGVYFSSMFSLDLILRFFWSPSLILLNTLPLTLIMLLLYFLTARLWASYFFAGSFFVAIQMVNNFRIRLRHEPFVPADLFLGNETTKVIRLSEVPINMYIVLGVGLFLIIGLFLLFFVKSKNAGVIFNAGAAVLTVMISVTVYNTLYKNVAYYNSFNIYGTEFSTVDTVESRGFFYSFLIKTSSYYLAKPEGYLPDDEEKLLKKYQIPPNVETSSLDNSPKKLPHIFAIMNESFFDIDRIKDVKFNKGCNPLENFHKISRTSSAGHIVTNVFGGGTACTELSFLTGHSISIMSLENDPYSYIRKDTFALPRVLENLGYNTVAFHPGFEWFYNRYNVYDYFGFQKRFFIDDMPIISDKNKINGYVRDMDAYTFMLDKFKEYLKTNSKSPYFNFTVTIENHGPYPKFNDNIRYNNNGNPEILKRNNQMTEETYQTINNYLYGLMDCDKALGHLVNQFEAMQEPIVLVFFGDHLPLLGEDFLGYKELNYPMVSCGSTDGYLNTYETPYFIWSNKVAKELLQKQGVKPIARKAPTISPNYLAVELLDYLGIQKPPYFNFLEETKSKMPVISQGVYKTSKNGITHTLNEDEKNVINEYFKLQYYLMFDKATKN